MDKLWRLMTAVFILLMGLTALMVAYIFFNGSSMVGVVCWTALILIACGTGKGLFAIIDYHRENTDEE